MPMPTPDLNDPAYVAHLAAGGCPSFHKDAKLWCRGKAGHYDYFDDRHWVKVVEMAGPRGVPVATKTITWV